VHGVGFPVFRDFPGFRQPRFQLVTAVLGGNGCNQCVKDVQRNDVVGRSLARIAGFAFVVVGYTKNVFAESVVVGRASASAAVSAAAGETADQHHSRKQGYK